VQRIILFHLLVIQVRLEDVWYESTRGPMRILGVGRVRPYGLARSGSNRVAIRVPGVARRRKRCVRVFGCEAIENHRSATPRRAGGERLGLFRRNAIEDQTVGEWLGIIAQRSNIAHLFALDAGLEGPRPVDGLENGLGPGDVGGCPWPWGFRGEEIKVEDEKERAGVRDCWSSNGWSLVAKTSGLLGDACGGWWWESVDVDGLGERSSSWAAAS
jgi:hypothetical protein